MSRTISSACSSSSECGDDVAHDLERVLVVFGEVVDDAGATGMEVAATELLGGDDLTDRRLHQRRSAEEDRALVADDHGLVAHRGNVGAASRAGSEHRRDLRHARCRHPRLVVEDASEVVAIREDLVLHRQECPAGIDEVDAREPVLECDLLRAEMLLDGEGVVRAALDGRVVADHHHVSAVHQADARDDARAGGLSPVHVARRQRCDLDEGAPLIEEARDAIAGQELPASDMALSRRDGPAEGCCRQPLPQIRRERFLGGTRAIEALVVGDRGPQGAHVISVDVTIGSRRLSRPDRLVSVH
jgi:hypothetical protein